MWYASVRTSRVFIKISGDIPGRLLQCLREHYGRRLTLKSRGEPMRVLLDAPLYQCEQLTMKSGDYLRFFRQDNGLSQAALGRKLGGLSRQDVSKLENGRRPISKRMALRLSGFFRASVDKFIREEYPASGGASDKP